MRMMLTNAQAGGGAETGGLEQPQPTTDQADRGAGSAGDPNPGSMGPMEPSGLCSDTQCEWNRPDPMLELLGAPTGWTWPHRHDGAAVLLEIEWR